jgi:YD repeat-containing protein
MSRIVLILSLFVLFPFVVFGVEQSVYDGTEWAQLGGKWPKDWFSDDKQGSAAPHFLEVSNITSSSAVITWLTEEPVEGVVEYGTTTNLGESVREGMGFWGRRVHSVRLEGLNPGERVYYQIVTDGGWQQLRSFVTAEAGTGVPAVVYGLVPEGTGKGDAIVKLRVKDGERSSAPLSCAFGLEGLWHLNLGNLKDSRGKVFLYKAGMEIEVVVEGLREDGKPAVLHKYDVVWSGDSDLSKDSGAAEKRLAGGGSIKSTVLSGSDEYAVEPAKGKTPERLYLEDLLEKTPELRQAREEKLKNRQSPVRSGWSGGNQMGEASAESRRPERREVLRLRGNVLQRELLELRRESVEASWLFPDVGRHLGIDEEIKEVRLPLVKSWNIVGLPLRPEEPVTAYNILEEVRGSRSIVSWEEERQRLGESVFKVGDQVVGNDFVLEEGKGYFLEMSDAGEIAFKGVSILPHLKKPQADGLTLVFLAGGRDHLPGNLFAGKRLVRFDETRQRFKRLDYGDVTVEEFSGAAIIRGAVIGAPEYLDTSPSLTITSPLDSSEIYTKQPMIEVIFGDQDAGIDTTSLKIWVNDIDVTSLFAIDTLSAVWYMSNPYTLNEGTNTVRAHIRNNVLNVTRATSTFDVVTLPPPVEQHYVNGYVYEDIDSVFTPLEGVAMVIEGIEGVIYTDSEGHYVFPIPGLGDYRLDFTKDWYTYAQRVLRIEEGHGNVFVDNVYLVPRDTVVVRITEEGGGTAVNSDNSVSAFFPAGAVSDDIDVSSNNIVRHIDLPYYLPSGAVFVTCVKFWPDQVQFQDSVIVDQSNWRSFDPGIDIPLGHYNPEELIWEDEGMIEVIDGDWQQFRAWHFMSWFVGCLPVFPPPQSIAEPSVIEDLSGSPANDYGGDLSEGSPTLGEVKLKFGGNVVDHPLPSVSSYGLDRSLSLTYASHTANPRVVISTATVGVQLPDSLPQYSGMRVDVGGRRFEAIITASRDTTVQRMRFDGKGEDENFLGSSHYYYEATPLNYEYAEYALTDWFGGPPGDSTDIITNFPVGFGVPVTGNLMIENRRDSEVGAGWALNGLQRLHIRPDGDVMVTDGGGSSQFYNRIFDGPVIDLAVTAADDDVISLFRGDGEGGFQDRQTISAEDYPVGIVTGDFDRDGFDDLAVANRDDKISIFLGEGDGGFESPSYLTGAVWPRFLVTDYLNGDEYLDLAVSNFNGGANDISIFLGDSLGGFEDRQDYDLGDLPITPSTADFNSDGFLDIAVALRNDDTVAVLLGDGEGVFDSTQYYIGGSLPADIAVEDFNGDGFSDMAVVSSGDNSVLVYLGDGQGNFETPWYYNAGTWPRYVDTGDFNGDDILDLAVTNALDSLVSVLLGNGLGGFPDRLEYRVGRDPQGIVVEDLNSDRILDLVTVNATDKDISILWGNGQGGFGNRQDLYAGKYPTLIITGNFNQDLYSPGFSSNEDDFTTLSVDTLSGEYTRIYPDSSRVVFDSTGLQVEAIDRVGNSTTYAYDGLDRLITVTAPGSLVTSLAYGPDSLLYTITDPAGRITWFDHDADSNLVSITDPDSSQWQ